MRARSFLTRFAWLSIAAAIITIGLKTVADLVTGSAGLGCCRTRWNRLSILLERSRRWQC